MPAEGCNRIFLLQLEEFSLKWKGDFMRAFIFANGDFCQQDTSLPINNDDLIIAADGGSQHCIDLDLQPNILIGDLDSVDEKILNNWLSEGVEIIRYSPDKDQTDLELALLYAQKQQVSEILVYGAAGGRLDMTIGNLTLLANPTLQIPITLICGSEKVHLLREGGSLSLIGKPGDTLSLIPLQPGPSTVTTEGLKYPLSSDILEFGYTKGISNQLVSKQARIVLEQGLLVVIHTHID